MHTKHVINSGFDTTLYSIDTINIQRESILSWSTEHQQLLTITHIFHYIVSI